MTIPLSQLSFRKPEPGLWICKKETIFFLNHGKTYTVKVGQPVVVISEQPCKGYQGAWKLVMPDGNVCRFEWQYDINGRWSKRFSLEYEVD